MIRLRSAVFALLQIMLTILFTLVAFASFPFSPLTRYRMITGYNHTVIWLARWVLGIRYVVRGREHLPTVPAVILSKHQSAWETLAFQQIFPPQVWVMKRSLLLLPFFGWGLAMVRPLAIDREAGRAALKQVTDQGRDRLQRGFWIVIFPEGTRVAPGKTGRYGIGGAWLATHTHTQVLPVAHNAGEFWGRNALRKRPGTITVSIGAPIDPAGMKPAELNAKVEAWIETEMGQIQASGVGRQASGE